MNTYKLGEVVVMKMKRWLGLLLAVAMVMPWVSMPARAAEAPLKVGVNLWVGWMPWWIVKEKGLLKKHGANAELVFFGVQSDSMTALAAGHLDACSLATNDVVSINANGILTKIVLLNDESYGADMLVARGIKDVKDLAGKKVALEIGGVSNFFLDTVLAKNGMSEKDVELLNMSASDAGSAFLAKTVDAAVTWEPYASQAIKGGGIALATSRDTPDAIVDVLAASDAAVQKRADDLKRVIDAWFEALDYVESNPDDAYSIMAKASDVSVEEFKTMWEGVRMYTRKSTLAAMGTPSAKGPYYKTVSDMSAFMMQQKLIEKPVDPAAIIDASLLSGAK
jgi:NitT/TauT family transport system substrate-binding protein